MAPVPGTDARLQAADAIAVGLHQDGPTSGATGTVGTLGLALAALPSCAAGPLRRETSVCV